MADAIRRREVALTTKVHEVLQTIAKDVAGAVVHRLGLAKLAIDSRANDADHDVSAAQRHAGNYRKGHLKLGPLDISIENPAGTRRRKDRPEWPLLPHHYGYIRRTEGADGDHVDCFVKCGTDDSWRGTVYVINQLKPDGETFDEHKVMLGWSSKGRAIRDYLRAYQSGWKVGPVTRLSFDEFVTWLRSGDTTLPVSKAGDDWADEITSADWSSLADQVGKATAKQFKATGLNELTSIGWGDDTNIQRVNDRAVDWADDNGADLITGISGATVEQLRGTIQDALEGGASSDDLASAIQDSYSFSAARASTIARTELSRAYNAANQAVGEIAGAVGKKWVLGSEHSAGDEDECDDNDEDGVIAWEDSFSSGDDLPPAHPNCVCTFESIYADDPEAEDI